MQFTKTPMFKKKKNVRYFFSFSGEISNLIFFLPNLKVKTFLTKINILRL